MIIVPFKPFASSTCFAVLCFFPTLVQQIIVPRGDAYSWPANHRSNCSHNPGCFNFVSTIADSHRPIRSYFPASSSTSPSTWPANSLDFFFLTISALKLVLVEHSNPSSTFASTSSGKPVTSNSSPSQSRPFSSATSRVNVVLPDGPYSFSAPMSSNRNCR